MSSSTSSSKLLSKSESGEGGEGEEETATLSVDFQKTLDLYEELQNTSIPTTDVKCQVRLDKIY